MTNALLKVSMAAAKYYKTTGKNPTRVYVDEYTLALLREAVDCTYTASAREDFHKDHKLAGLKLYIVRTEEEHIHVC